jgi:hypothetical protein
MRFQKERKELINKGRGRGIWGDTGNCKIIPNKIEEHFIISGLDVAPNHWALLNTKWHFKLEDHFPVTSARI